MMNPRIVLVPMMAIVIMTGLIDGVADHVCVLALTAGGGPFQLKGRVGNSKTVAGESLDAPFH